MVEPTAKDLGIKFTIEGRPLAPEGGEEGVTDDTDEGVTEDARPAMADPAIDWHPDELARLQLEIRYLAISHIILVLAVVLIGAAMLLRMG